MILINKMNLLNDNNYYVLSLKWRFILKARKLYKVVLDILLSDDIESIEYKNRVNWEGKNDETFRIIITTLSDP